MSEVRFLAASNKQRLILPLYNETTFHYCEDLSLLDPDNIVSVFLTMMIMCSPSDGRYFDRRFSLYNISRTDLNAGDSQDVKYDCLLPIIYVHIASLVPKNPTASLITHQKSRFPGIDRAAIPLGLQLTADNYIISNAALASLQSFLSSNTDILGEVFRTYLGYCVADNRTTAYAYAMELLPNLKYGNMQGVRVVEENIMATNHSVLADSTVSTYYRHYLAFKGQVVAKYGLGLFPMVALLNKDIWMDYSRQKMALELRKICTMMASETNPTFNNIEINGQRVSDLKEHSPYSHIWETYKSEGYERLQVNDYHKNGISQVLRNRAIRVDNAVSGNNQGRHYPREDAYSADTSSGFGESSRGS